MKKQNRFLAVMGGMNALSSILAVVAGLLAGFIILLISNPSQAFSGFIAILTGGFSDMFNLGQVFYYAAPIIMTGLSVGFAGKTGLFNIGASGQFTSGMFAAILVALKCSFLPNPLQCAVAVLAGLLAGAIWGAIPGIFKALRNVHEVISCIMMNYIGMYLVNYLIKQTGIYDQLRNMTMRVPSGVNLPTLGLNELFSVATDQGSVRNSSVGSGILIAIVLCALIYVLLEKTKFGYELKACGYNPEAARYAGINENRGIISSMAISGALAGMGGALIALAGAGRGIAVVDVLASEGFNGIPVALLGLNHPIGILFSGFLIAYLTQSGFLLQRFNFAPEIIDIIVSVIIYFSALALLLKGFIQFFLREKKRKQLVDSDAGPPGDFDALPQGDSGESGSSKEGDS
jgi:simple sugar transport system permease protein